MSAPASETKVRILEVAARLFHERGFRATGVATILREAGVNSGSLYHFFPSKEAVLAGVLQRHLDTVGRVILEPAQNATDDHIERVFALLELYRRRLLLAGVTRGCPIGNLALEVADGRPRIRALIEENFSAWTSGVRSWLEAAGDRLPADVDRGELSRLVLAVMQGAVMQARAAGTLEPFDASVAGLRSYMDLLQERARRERPEPGVERPEPGVARPEPGRRPGETWAVPAGEGAALPAETAQGTDGSDWRAW